MRAPRRTGARDAGSGARFARSKPAWRGSVAPVAAPAAGPGEGSVAASTEEAGIWSRPFAGSGASVTRESLKGAATYSPDLQLSTRDGTIAASQWLPVHVPSARRRPQARLTAPS